MCGRRQAIVTCRAPGRCSDRSDPSGDGAEVPFVRSWNGLTAFWRVRGGSGLAAGWIVVGRPVVDAAEQVGQARAPNWHGQDRLVVDAPVGRDQEQGGLVEYGGLVSVDPAGDEQTPLTHLRLAQAVGQRDLVELPLVAHLAGALLVLAADRDNVNSPLGKLVEAAIEL